jgi:hypothetical protein
MQSVNGWLPTWLPAMLLTLQQQPHVLD